VTARAVTTKAKRREPLPLDQTLARELLAWRKAVAQERGGRVPPATEAVFAVPKNLTVQLRKDAKHAEVPLEDDHGRKLDFHALRATFATLLAKAGVPLQIGRGLIRHTDPKLTAKHYEKLALSDLRAGSLLVASAFWEGASVAPVAANVLRDPAKPGAALRTHEPERKDGTG